MLFRPSAHFLIGLFVFLILGCMSCLYILEINPWLVASFANISPILCVVFHSVYGFLCCAKAFKSHLFIFLFIYITLGDRSEKILL